MSDETVLGQYAKDHGDGARKAAVLTDVGEYTCGHCGGSLSSMKHVDELNGRIAAAIRERDRKLAARLRERMDSLLAESRHQERRDRAAAAMLAASALAISHYADILEADD